MYKLSKSYHAGHASPKYPRLAVKRCHNPYAEETCLQAHLALHRFCHNKPKIRRPQPSASMLFPDIIDQALRRSATRNRSHCSPQALHDLNKTDQLLDEGMFYKARITRSSALTTRVMLPIICISAIVGRQLTWHVGSRGKARPMKNDGVNSYYRSLKRYIQFSELRGIEI